MKHFNPKEIIKPIVVLFVICVGVAAISAGVDDVTRGPIARRMEEKAEKTRVVVLPNADKFEKLDLTLNGVSECCRGTKGDQTVGYTFITSSNGYNGKVEVMVGIDGQKGEISGVSVISQGETPGLGANAVKKEFTDQYKQIADKINVVKNIEPKEGEVQALTGATITSKAVTDAVNNAVAAYDRIRKGG